MGLWEGGGLNQGYELFLYRVWVLALYVCVCSAIIIPVGGVLYCIGDVEWSTLHVSNSGPCGPPPYQLCF